MCAHTQKGSWACLGLVMAAALLPLSREGAVIGATHLFDSGYASNCSRPRRAEEEEEGEEERNLINLKREAQPAGAPRFRCGIVCAESSGG